MVTDNNWYNQKTIKYLGALFVVLQRQKMWAEFPGVRNVKATQYTQLQLLDFVTQTLRLRSSQIVPITIESHKKQFALICSDHEKQLEQGIKRGFAFVGLNQDGSLAELTDLDANLIEDYVDIVQQKVNGYSVWRGVLGPNVKF